MSKLLLLVGAAAAATILLYLFYRWERAGREHWVVFLLLSLLVAEASLYENGNTMPRGLFHPGSGSFQFRLPEVLIALALVARLVVKGRPKWIGVPAMLWAAMAGWMAVEMIEGLVRHNSTVKLPYEAKAIIYVMGGYALASGVPIRRFLDGPGFQRLLRWTAIPATALVILALAKKTYNVHLPLVPLSNFGELGTDAATIFVVIGMIGLLLELAKEHRRAVNLLCPVPMFISAFLAYQRAVLLTLGASTVVVILASLGTTARRRLRVRGGEVAVAALAVIGVVLGLAVVPALTGQKSITSSPILAKITKTVNSTLGSQAKSESAQARLNKWGVAYGDAKLSPILGQGLGYTYSYFEPGPNQFVMTDLTENLGLDLWLRTGLIGLALFLVALVVSIANGLTAWRLHPDRMVAVLALGLVAGVIGLFAKGMVESIFENYRLATVLGLTLGMLRSAVTSGGGNLLKMRTHYEPERALEGV
ncbi:MAG TPA: O-antigen ligase family protein [Acidimicrobiales bacterium]|nr:O-antigen ligase family protein [Acidimicrobiales bacterium]